MRTLTWGLELHRGQQEHDKNSINWVDEISQLFFVIFLAVIGHTFLYNKKQIEMVFQLLISTSDTSIQLPADNVIELTKIPQLFIHITFHKCTVEILIN